MNTSYVSDANQVNEYNVSLSNLASARALEAKTILDLCKNISFSAYLTNNASVIYAQDIINTEELIIRGTIPPFVSPNDTLGLEQNTQKISTIDASANVILQREAVDTTTQLVTTTTLLNQTQLFVNTISQKAILTASLNTLIKYILKSFSHSILILLNTKNNILSNDILNSSNTPSYTIYLPTVPVKNSLTATNNSINIIHAFLSAIVNMTGDTAITNLIQETVNISNGLDTTARINDTTAYNYANTAKLNPIQMNIDIASIMTPVSLASDTSASNFRYISNTLESIKRTYNNLVAIDSSVQQIFTNALKSLLNIHILVDPVLKNSSRFLANSINTKTYNRVIGELKRATDLESSSLAYAKDITTIYNLIVSAKQTASTTISTNPISTQTLLWSVNSITDEAQTQYNTAENIALLLNTKATTLVTPDIIEFQTNYSTNAAKSIANDISRLTRQSSLLPSLSAITTPPKFKADIRVRMPLISRNRPENSLYRKPGVQFNLSSINTLSESRIQITKETQQIKDNSILLSKN